MYIPKFFKISELVHPNILAEIGENNALARLDADCLRDLDYIREEWSYLYQSGVYCNRLNHNLDSRGLRPPNDPDGAKYSTHKNGNTFDLEPVNGENRAFFEFVRGLIKARRLKAFNTLENFEKTLKWVHVAKMNVGRGPVIINP